MLISSDTPRALLQRRGHESRTSHSASLRHLSFHETKFPQGLAEIALSDIQGAFRASASACSCSIYAWPRVPRSFERQKVSICSKRFLSKEALPIPGGGVPPFPPSRDTRYIFLTAPLLHREAWGSRLPPPHPLPAILLERAWWSGLGATSLCFLRITRR